MFQMIFNGINSSSIQWFFTFEIAFENLEIHQNSNSQSGSPLASVWAHSLTFSYTLGECECDSQVAFSALTFLNPYFSRKPLPWLQAQG
jgi:hypothetical protein